VGIAGVASQSAILLVQRRGGGVRKSHHWPVLTQRLMTSFIAKPVPSGFSRQDCALRSSSTSNTTVPSDG
jgi:hypothetical protein